VSWRVVIRPNAEADAREARLWYESQRTGLGDELLEEIRHAIRVLEEHPEHRLFTIAASVACSPADSPTNSSTASKATRSLSFASCTPNGIIAGNWAVDVSRLSSIARRIW
jgi:hypothetical protein